MKLLKTKKEKRNDSQWIFERWKQFQQIFYFGDYTTDCKIFVYHLIQLIGSQ